MVSSKNLFVSPLGSVFLEDKRRHQQLLQEKSAKGKKKQEPVKDMRSDPPIYEQVGSKNVVLNFLLDGGSLLEEVLHLGGGPMIDPEELKKMEAAERLQVRESEWCTNQQPPQRGGAVLDLVGLDEMTVGLP